MEDLTQEPEYSPVVRFNVYYPECWHTRQDAGEEKYLDTDYTLLPGHENTYTHNTIKWCPECVEMVNQSMKRLGSATGRMSAQEPIRLQDDRYDGGRRIRARTPNWQKIPRMIDGMYVSEEPPMMLLDRPNLDDKEKD